MTKQLEQVKPLYDMYATKYPDNPPSLIEIDRILKMFWDLIEEQLLEEKEPAIWGFGKMISKYKYNKQLKRYQWYIKFLPSKHFNARFRKVKGTATDSDLKLIEDSKSFMNDVWRKRHKSNLEKDPNYVPRDLTFLDQYNDVRKELGLDEVEI